MALHDILTNRRIEVGISLDEIVKRSGVPKGTVAKIMSGITPNPQIESLKAIAYALGLTLDDLDESPRKSDSALSPEALALAAIFDRLDPHSKRVVESVAKLESERTALNLPKGITPMSEMPMHSIPSYGVAKCDGSIETKHAAKGELAEMQTSEPLPVE